MIVVSWGTKDGEGDGMSSRAPEGKGQSIDGDTDIVFGHRGTIPHLLHHHFDDDLPTLALRVYLVALQPLCTVPLSPRIASHGSSAK